MPVSIRIPTLVLLALVPFLSAGAPRAQKGAGGGRVASVPSDKTIAFVRATEPAGLAGLYTEGNSHNGGVAWVDYNGDFWPDLFITNGPGHGHWMFRNEGDGTFTDVSNLVPKPDLALPEAGVKFGDLDNDGDSEILVVVDSEFTASQGQNQPNGGPNLLYVNQGGQSFVEDAAGTGVLDPQGRRNICAGLADYDRDGFLDLYIANWQLNDTAAANWDRILHNDGDGTFTDVTAQLGLNAYGRDTLTCLWFDMDMDGWQDLYVGVAGAFKTPQQNTDDIFWRNLGGAGFADVTGDPNVLGNDAQAAMGCDVGDIDNDGDWDLYITDIYVYPVAPLGNPLYLGDGQGSFQDNTADLAGVQANNSWPCCFADFDRDGWVDLWVGCQGSSCPDWLYRNRGDGTFETVHDESLWFNALRGGSVADYDGDGDVDIFLWNYRQDSELVRNVSTDAGHWLELKLLGTLSNRDAIGAVVRASAGGITQMRRVSGGDSAHSQQDLIVHFGLGPAPAASVTIDWPSGTQTVLPAVGADQLVFVDESAGLLSEDLVSAAATWYAQWGFLQVDVQSSFGGRTRLAATGLGPLDYRAQTTSHRAGFGGVATNPGTVEITSERGGSWTVAVQTVP